MTNSDINNQPIDVHAGKNNEPHYFHTTCIAQHRHNLCPLCRQRMEIREKWTKKRQMNDLINRNGHYTQNTGVSKLGWRSHN